VAAKVAYHAVDVLGAQTVCHCVGGGGFEVVSLVDDKVVIGGQNAVFGGGICQQEGVIDHQNVGTLGSHARFIEGAASAGAFDAVFEFTALVFSRKPAPDQTLGHAVQVQLTAVAALAGLQPDQHLAHHAQFIEIFGFAPAHGVEATRAEIVAAPFEHCRLDIQAGGFDQVGDVFLDQLILQGDGVGGDDDPLFIRERPSNTGDQVCQRFACAGAGLDHQVLPPIESVGDCPEHFHLLRTMFKACDVLRECPARFQNRSQFFNIDRLELRVWLERFGTHWFAKLKKQTAFLVEHAFWLDALLDQVLQDPAEGQLSRPSEPLALLDHLSDQIDGQLRELLKQFVVNAHGRAGIVDGAMRIAKDDAKLVAERAQAISRRGWHQHRCQFVRVDDRVYLKSSVALEEADVKADILPQDGKIANEGLQLWVDIR